MSLRRLSDNEAAVFGQIEFSPHRSCDEIGRSIRLRPSTVGSVMRRLQDHGTIWQRAFVDPMRAGFQDIGIFFNVYSSTPAARRKAESYFIASPNVSWLGTLAGEFQYGAVFLCHHVAELSDFLERVAQECEISFGDRVVSPRITYRRFPRRYIGLRRPRAVPLEFRFDATPVEFDALDLRILSALDTKSFHSFRSLAHGLGTPVTTIDRRIRILRELGVIRGFLFELDTESLGIGMSRILIAARGPRQATRAVLEEFCAQCPNVTYAIEAMGTWDHEIGFETMAPSADSAVLSRFYDQCGSVLASVRVIREMQDLKFQYASWTHLLAVGERKVEKRSSLNS